MAVDIRHKDRCSDLNVVLLHKHGYEKTVRTEY